MRRGFSLLRQRAELLIVGLIVTVNVVIRLPRLNQPIVGGWEFRFAWTAWGVRSLSRNGLNPFGIDVPVLGPPWKAPHEFPFYQFMAASLVRFLGLDEVISARIVAVLISTSTGIVIYLLSRRLFGRLSALCALLLAYFSAYALNWGTEVLPDFFAATCGAVLLLLVVRSGSRTSKRQFILLTLAAGLAMHAKAMTGIVWCAGATLWILLSRQISIRRRIHYVMAIAAGIVTVVPWSLWTESVKNLSPHTEHLKTRNYLGWAMLSWRDRLEMGGWRTFLEHSFQPITGDLVVALVLLLCAARFVCDRRSALTLSTIIIGGPLVFSGLYITHDYYFIAVFPAFVVLAGHGIANLARLLTGPRTDQDHIGLIAGTGVMAVVLMSWISKEGVENMNRVFEDRPVDYATYEMIVSHSRPDDAVIVIGLDRNPTLLYMTDRRGLQLITTGPRADAAQLGTLYTRVYWAEPNPTPEQWAEYFPADLRYEAISSNFYRIFPITG